MWADGQFAPSYIDCRIVFVGNFHVRTAVFTKQRFLFGLAARLRAYPSMPTSVLPQGASSLHRRPGRKPAADSNRLARDDRPAHDWYRFVLSYPPHLVRDYVGKFGLHEGHCVLDPFCGTGTTVVECKKLGLASVGVEAHPMAHFAGATKTNWRLAPERLRDAARRIAGAASSSLAADGIVDDPQSHLLCEPAAPLTLRTLPEEKADLLLANSISPLPLHKVLTLLDAIDSDQEAATRPFLRLAVAKALVGPVGNLHFGPEVGVGPAKPDAPVISTWFDYVQGMADDLEILHSLRHTPSVVHHADSRQITGLVAPESVDAVITSPPYPNEKDYTRTTRLESVLLGFFTCKQELQNLKKTMLRSNTRGVYKADTDDLWVKDHVEIQRIAADIETRRIELGKTSGFERLYARVTKLYFGGMARHLTELTTVLRPGAQLAYVVGDQASYLRVMIRTGQLLASLAEQIGYEVIGLDLFRTRLATATGEQLREEVLVLRWPGKN